MTRACRACDGTGVVGVVQKRASWPYDEHELCDACEDGCVEERIPASDALADAETLLGALKDTPDGWRALRLLQQAQVDLFMARGGALDFCHERALDGAHRALCAVPGLRA